MWRSSHIDPSPIQTWAVKVLQRDYERAGIGMPLVVLVSFWTSWLLTIVGLARVRSAAGIGTWSRCWPQVRYRAEWHSRFGRQLGSELFRTHPWMQSATRGQQVV